MSISGLEQSLRKVTGDTLMGSRADEGAREKAHRGSQVPDGEPHRERKGKGDEWIVTENQKK